MSEMYVFTEDVPANGSDWALAHVKGELIDGEAVKALGLRDVVVRANTKTAAKAVKAAKATAVATESTPVVSETPVVTPDNEEKVS